MVIKMKHTMKYSCVLMAAACVLSLAGCGGGESAPAQATDPATNVTIYTVENGTVADIGSYTGEIKEGDIASVSSKINAKVMSVTVEEGSFVSAGTVLASLDATDLQLAYDQSLAAYNSALANYDMTANATTAQSETSARQTLASAEIECNDAAAAYSREKALYDSDTSLVAARNAYSDAQMNYGRMEQLFEAGAISQVELDSAKTSMENAAANVTSMEANKQTTLDAAKTRYDNAVNRLNAAKENLDLTVNVVNEKSTSVSKANVDSARAALNIAKNNLANTSIVAPISGYVASRKINKGQMVSPGVEIFTIKNTNNVDAEFSVTESVIPLVTEGSPAVISVKSAGISDIAGTVTAVNQTKDAATGLYSVKVSIDNSSNQLKIGMFADISLTLKAVDSAAKIPLEAVLQEGESMYVYVAEGNTAQRRDIVTGISDGEYTEVVSGLQAGEQIVVKGKEYLSEKNNQISVTQS